MPSSEDYDRETARRLASIDRAAQTPSPPHNRGCALLIIAAAGVSMTATAVGQVLHG